MVSRKKYLEKESEAEMRACTLLGSTSAPHILEQNGLVEKWPSSEHKRNRNGDILEEKAKKVDVRGQDVFSLATWNGGDRKSDDKEPRNFLKYAGYKDTDLISLVELENKLTNEFFDFLTLHFTDRYALLDMEGKEWLRKVVRLAVLYHIMRNKAAGYVAALTTGIMDEDYLCSPFAAFCYQILQVVKLSGSDVASKVNFIVKRRPEIEALEQQVKTLESDPEVAYRQDELSSLQAQLKAMKESDRDYRQKLIGEFIDEHFKRITNIVRIIAKIANIPEFQQLANELSHEEEGDAA